MRFRLPFAFIFIFSSVCAASAQKADFSDTGPPVPLDRVDVTAAPVTPAITTQTLPTDASITAQHVDATVNVLDTEDAVKYLPSLFLRKRNIGDTQAVMATRVWGVSSSARSLVFADGVPLSALVANNNNIGAPRWGLVAPAEVARIDIMYGPFSAGYAGNSMGAVMEITTRLPDHAEGSLVQTEAWQHFHQYGTKDDFLSHQTSFTAGDRLGKFSFWISGNAQDSESQPLSYVTAAAFPVGTTGGYTASNKLGAPANVLGAGGLLHTRMAEARVKAAYDVTPWLRAIYTIGVWRNDGDSAVETYLRNGAGQPTFAGQGGFASGRSFIFAQHTSQSLALRTATGGAWDFEAIASAYRFDHDRQSTPNTASATNDASLGFSPAGRVAVLDGTGWSTLDLKGTWRLDAHAGAHVLTFGAHDDQYRLFNPTYNTPDWVAGNSYTSVATEGDGKTRTQALWMQDAWQMSPAVKATLGFRWEDWTAYDGYNVNGATAIRQPTVTASNGSPKARVAWTAAPTWTVTASIGQAYRYATAAELYQLVSTGPTFTAPNPNLKPDDVLATELSVEHTLGEGTVRLSFFQDDIHNAIISQFLPLVPNSSTLYSYLANVDHVRARGIEAWIEQRNVFVRGLDYSASVTALDARTLALSGQASATAPAGSAIGKRLPNIPEWRGSFTVTYRPDQRWAFSAAGRYSGMMYTTLDDADVNPNTYQGFGAWFVADIRATCRIDHRWSAALGVDNLLNREYFLFHPFPQRTVVAQLKCTF